MFSSYPRFRLYTTFSSYRSIILDKLLGRQQKGDDVQRLEQELADFLEVEHAVCVPQNRVGVYLTIKNLIDPGQEVIMSPYTIADISNMVILAGGVPVYADVERSTCNIDAKEVAKLFTASTGAVLVTHLHGLAAPNSEIKKLCEHHNVPLIEDAAQAFGAKNQNRRLGTIGNAGVFSFGSFKNINSWLGGAVVSNDKKLVKRIRNELMAFDYQQNNLLMKKVKKGLLTDIVTYPLVFKFFTLWIFRYGFLHDIEAINRRVRTELDVSRTREIPAEYLAQMTPSQARLVRRQLSSVDGFSAARIERARLYHEGLSDINELIIPLFSDDFSHIYTYFPVQYENREKLLKYLMKHNRDIAAQHYKNNATLPGFEEFYRPCPNASAVADQLIFLPTYPSYPISEVERNIETIRKYFKENN